MNEITIREPSEITPVRNLESLIPEWENDLQSRVAAQEISADTMKGYKAGAIRFMSWLQLTGDRPDPAGIRQWKAELLTKYKPAAVNAWLAGVRSFFTWLAEKGQIPFNPTQAIKGATRRGTGKRHARQALTNAEVRAVLSQPDNKRDYAILATMLYTAARTIEIHRANLEDLKTEGGKLVLYVQGKGKTEKDEIVIITSKAESALLEWIAERGQQSGPLFTSASDRSHGMRLSRRAIREIIKRNFRAAGVNESKTAHSLRHTAITSAIRHGGDPIRVKGMSRHASLDTLMIYYHEEERTNNPAEELIDYDG